MELNIKFEKFGPQSKEIISQIKKWKGSETAPMLVARYLQATWRNKAAIAYLCGKEVVGYALVEQFYNEDEKQGQCNIDHVCVNPDALHSGIENFVVASIVENRNKILAKKAPTLFMAHAGKEQTELVEALEQCGFGEFENEGDFVVAIKSNNKINERE